MQALGGPCNVTAQEYAVFMGGIILIVLESLTCRPQTKVQEIRKLTWGSREGDKQAASPPVPNGWVSGFVNQNQTGPLVTFSVFLPGCTGFSRLSRSLALCIGVTRRYAS